MVDNSPIAYSWQQMNGLPILSWYGDLRDKELEKMIPILERLAQVDDVRKYIPKIASNSSVNYYEAFRILKAPREASPLDGILKSLSDFRKGAAALIFRGTNQKDDSQLEENKEE